MKTFLILFSLFSSSLTFTINLQDTFGIVAYEDYIEVDAVRGYQLEVTEEVITLTPN